VYKLRLVLAIGHAEIQRFIVQDRRVDVSDIAENTEELLEIITYSKADTIILSKYIRGDENQKDVIEKIKAIRPEMRIIYLYGVEDDARPAFIKYLESKNIFDYYVGDNLSSSDLNELLFRFREKDRSKNRGLFKKRTKALWFKELDSAVISIYSNCTNGKSNFAWNLSAAFASKGYRTTIINLDRGYSANIYFGIEDIYYDLLDYLIAHEDHKSILDSCYKRGNVSVITGRLGNDSLISKEDFLKILYFARSKSDIVIIDTYTGLNEITLQAINNSNIDFLIFDSDLMHFHMNKLMIEKLSSSFIGEKTYGIINNSNTASESYKYIYKQINKLNIELKGVLPVSSCGSLGCDLMYTGKTPYETAKINSNFIMDIDNILKAINVRNSRVRSKYVSD
jgi:MinD-like ATPase involved in chromosome partitioning or flagellar assembly